YNTGFQFFSVSVLDCNTGFQFFSVSVLDCNTGFQFFSVSVLDYNTGFHFFSVSFLILFSVSVFLRFIPVSETGFETGFKPCS
ncbi:Uncharacterized protein FWK35_00032427, partial [Aphis craccivora]